jgi:hypothetical protein
MPASKLMFTAAAAMQNAELGDEGDGDWICKMSDAGGNGNRLTQRVCPLESLDSG